jgi:hypothetical protein
MDTKQAALTYFLVDNNPASPGHSFSLYQRYEYAIKKYIRTEGTLKTTYRIAVMPRLRII